MASSPPEGAGPRPEDLYEGLRIPANEWFDSFEAYKSAKASRLIANNMWFALLKDYFRDHVGLTNALNQVPQANRNNMPNIRASLIGTLFPAGQPIIATRATTDYHSGSGFPHPSCPMAVLEEMRRLLARMAPGTAPNDADQVRHLMRHVSEEYSARLEAANPATLDAAAIVLRDSAALRLPGPSHYHPPPPPSSVPIFAAMGGGDHTGNRAATTFTMHSPAPVAVSPAIATGNILAQVRDVVKEAVGQLKTDMRAELQSTMKAQSARHEQRMDAVAASINSLNVGTKRRSDSPRSGQHYREDEGHFGDKRGRYGERPNNRRGEPHCVYCFDKGWDKYTTHNSADCFQHPNPMTAQNNWESYRHRAGISDRRQRRNDRRQERRAEDRKDTHRTDPYRSDPKPQARSAPSDEDIRAMVDREASRRVQQLQDQAAQQQRDRKIDELHQALLSHDRRRERDERTT